MGPRTIITPPPVHIPHIAPLPAAEHWTLSNGLKVVAIPVDHAPVLSLELIWRAGRPYESRKLVADATNALLVEGVAGYSAAELEATFEYHGTALQLPEEMDTANLRLATLTRHLDRLLPLFVTVATAPAFSAQSFQRYLRRSRQQLREDLKDPDALAYRALTERTLGTEKPYGYVDYLRDYDMLGLDDLRQHHAHYYGAANATLLVIGQLTDAIRVRLSDTFGAMESGKCAPNPAYSPPAASGSFTSHRIHRPQAQQTMIRMGRRGIDIASEDYPGLAVLETILGGYYGSRLMRNIREEKGLTYGIETDVDTYRYDGLLTISADVANKNVALVRNEIAREIDQLRQDRVPASELDMVRAYLLGGLTMSLDGPFAVASRYRSAIIKGYDAAEHLRRVDATVRGVGAEEVRDLAEKYLGEWTEVSVGNGHGVVDSA